MQRQLRAEWRSTAWAQRAGLKFTVKAQGASSLRGGRPDVLGRRLGEVTPVILLLPGTDFFFCRDACLPSNARVALHQAHSW
jgi:hypothetical protein